MMREGGRDGERERERGGEREVEEASSPPSRRAVYPFRKVVNSRKVTLFTGWSGILIVR